MLRVLFAAQAKRRVTSIVPHNEHAHDVAKNAKEKMVGKFFQVHAAQFAWSTMKSFGVLPDQLCASAQLVEKRVT